MDQDQNFNDDLLKRIHQVTEIETKKQEIVNPAMLVPSEYDYTVKNLKNLIDQGQPVLEHLSDLAMQLNTADAFTAYSSLLKTMSSLSKNVLEANKIKIQMDKDLNSMTKDDGNMYQQINNNFTIYATTEEVLKQISESEQKLKEKVIDVEEVVNEPRE